MSIDCIRKIVFGTFRLNNRTLMYVLITDLPILIQLNEQEMCRNAYEKRKDLETCEGGILLM